MSGNDRAIDFHGTNIIKIRLFRKLLQQGTGKHGHVTGRGHMVRIVQTVRIDKMRIDHS